MQRDNRQSKADANIERGAASMAAYTPPYNIEAEQSVLGSMLIDRERIEDAAVIVSEADFYRENHQLLFRCMLALCRRGEPVDLITVQDDLTKRDLLDKIGGMSYITALFDSVPSASNIEFYARIVSEKATLRRVIDTALGIIGMARDPELESVADLTDQAHKMIDTASEGRASSEAGWNRAGELAIQLYDKTEEWQSGVGALGVKTGFASLDRPLTGLHPQYYIVAARPSMGKSALCFQTGKHIARSAGIPVYIYSLEMTREKIASRLVCESAGIDSMRLRNGQLSADEWERYHDAVVEINDLPIWIESSFDSDLTRLVSKIKRKIRREGPGVVIIDHLGKVRVPGTESRRLEVAAVSQALSMLPGELNVPVIGICPLSRGVESRDSKRPVMSDLAESGNIESDARVIMLVYRPAYYGLESNGGKLTRPYESDEVQPVEIIIAKNDDGPTTTVNLGFIPMLTRFGDVDTRHEMSYPKDARYGA